MLHSSEKWKSDVVLLKVLNKCPVFCLAHLGMSSSHQRWLPVQVKVHLKVPLLNFKIVNGLAPSYLNDLINVC